MVAPSRRTYAATALLTLALAAGPHLASQAPSPGTGEKGRPVNQVARGEFDVKLTPQAGDATADPSLGRMSISKQFRGDLEGAGQGQMLTGMTAVEGSAVYVAVERVTGTLHGRRGSFVLVHRGVMTRGQPDLSVIVAPDSGTGDLAGISGHMTIDIASGKHAYTLEYSLPPAP